MPTIGPHVTIKGDIRSEEDLMIDGQVEGTLDLGQHRLVVGPNAQIHARITAREVEVQGVMHGDVEAVERIILRKTSKVVGDMKIGGVVIEDGANFKGSIDIIRPQGAEPPAPAVTAKPPASQALVKVFPEASVVEQPNRKTGIPARATGNAAPRRSRLGTE